MASIRTYRIEETPRTFLDLAWHVFFASRGRGVSLDAHFPWLSGGGRNDRSWCLNVDGDPAAMLCVRQGHISGTDFYAIGLVCTAPAFVRRGFATRLVEAALAAIGDDAPVLLWTSQHGFYERLGFTLLDPSVVVTRSFPVHGASASWQRHDWYTEDWISHCFGGRRGLPTFVTTAERRYLIGDATAALIVADGATPIVLDLAADTTPALLAAIGAPRLVLNLPRPTKLLGRLRAAGVVVDVRETAIAMWRPGHIDRAAIEQWDIPLLDRF